MDRLRQYLREQLSTQLSQRIRDDESSGRAPMGTVARRQMAEAILQDAAEAHAQAEMRQAHDLVRPLPGPGLRIAPERVRQSWSWPESAPPP